MAHYSYHNRIKQRIAAGEFTRCEFVEDYKKGGPRLLLYFTTEPYIRPVREHAYHLYHELF